MSQKCEDPNCVICYPPENDVLFAVLVELYKQGYKKSASLSVAELCDNTLDRSGGLLGRVRDAAYAKKEFDAPIHGRKRTT